MESFEVNIKKLTIISLALALGACTSVPPPPHCKDDGKGLQPINPEMLTQETINTVRASEKATERFDSRGGNRK